MCSYSYFWLACARLDTYCSKLEVTATYSKYKSYDIARFIATCSE